MVYAPAATLEDAWCCLSTDAKPVSAKEGQELFELDTGITWRFGQGGWWKARTSDQFADRGGSTKTAIRYEATGVAPHAQSARAQYIVPAGKWAQIQYGQLTAVRSAAASAAGISELWLSLVAASGGAEQRYTGVPSANGTTVGVPISISTISWSLLGPGDQLTAYSRDTSTGGAIDYKFGIIVLEFDQ